MIEKSDMGARSFCKSVLRRWPALYSTRLVYTNLRQRLGYQLGDIGTDSGRAHSHASLDDSLKYIRDVFEDYRHYAGIDRFYGRVAEVGPGDSCGVGILFLQDGCTQVDLVDKYYSRRDANHQARIVQRLTEANPALFRPGVGICANECTEGQIVGLSRHYGQQASAEIFFRENRGYDFIVSRAVLEHVDDPRASLAGMAAALNRGGVLLHKVDLTDHEMFTPEHGDLTFLRFRDWYYALIARGSGRPNRILVDRYRSILDSTGLDYRILVTKLIGVGPIAPHVEWDDIDQSLRDKAVSAVRKVQGTLARNFRCKESKDLAVSGIFIVAQKQRI
jgi:SAM-dependent methyltransferase